ncbi:YfjI family protein [Enterobacter hormaechei]
MSKLNEELCLDLLTLPRYYRRMLEYLYYKTGAPIEILLPVILGAMSLACQDMFDVEPIPGRRYPTSLFILILAKSGSRKSTIFRIVLEAVTQLEQEIDTDFREEVVRYERALVLWKAEAAALEKCYKKAVAQNADTTEAYQALDDAHRRKPVRPVKRRLMTSDPTNEALGKELGLGYPVLMLVSDESGGLLDGNLFRNTPQLNALWCGDTINVARASTESYTICDARFGMMLAMQPELFDSFLSRHGKKMRHSGFLPRCMLVDLDQVPKVCRPEQVNQIDGSLLQEFFTTQIKHLLAGVQRRKEGAKRTCVTFSHEAQALFEETDASIRDHMKTGGALQHYDDFSSRFVEHASRIAAVMQIFITPDSPIVTKDTLISALSLTEWFLNHFIKKVDSTREPSDDEKVLLWLEDHLAVNGSFEFKRNDIIKKGPSCVRRADRLMPALRKLEKKGKIQLYDECGTNYVRFIGAEMEPVELAVKTNTPIHLSGPIFMSKLLVK